MSEHWRERALCRGQDPTFWFPATPTPRGGNVSRKKIRMAIATCERCPVRKECHDSAIENKEEGIWGGYWFRKVNGGRSTKVVTLA